MKTNYFLIFIFLSGFILANQSSTEFQELQEKYNSKTFNYTVDPPKDETNSLNLDPLANLLSLVNWNFVMYTIIGLCLLLIVYTLYKRGLFMKYDQNKSNESAVNHFDYIENNLLEINLEEMITQAITAKEYRLAIRYYHYLNTQNLAKKGYFIWDPKKTNVQFITLIKQRNIQQLFQENTRIFNQVWFGNFELEEQQFKIYEKNFQQLNEAL